MTGNTKQQTQKTGIITDESDSLFCEIFNKIQTGIIIIDPATHIIVDANPMAVLILGHPKEKMLGNTCHDFICPTKKGACPITDQHHSIDNAEREIIAADGKKRAILKTVAGVTIRGKNYLVESFVDQSDRIHAEDQKVILIGYLSESVHRIRRPLELTKMNLQIIADQIKSGEFTPEEIRMELQIQANNIEKMLQNLDELAESVTLKENEIPQEFRKFILGK